MDDNNKIEPVIVNSYESKENPVVFTNYVQNSSSEEPIVIKKKKTKIRNLVIEPFQKQALSMVRLNELANNLMLCYSAHGLEISDTRAKAFIASMISSRLVFLNKKDIEHIDVLFDFFGCMPNVTNLDEEKIEASDAIKAIYSAKYNKDAVGLVVLETSDAKKLDIFNGHFENPYSYNGFKIDMIINDIHYYQMTIPNNCWILVVIESDKDVTDRSCGSYSKIGARISSKTLDEYKKPNYDSFKDAFINVKNHDNEPWDLLDDVLNKIDYDFSNKELNMIDDYYVSLIEMGFDMYEAVDYLIINKIFYVTDKVTNLREYNKITMLKFTKLRLERM